MKRLQKERKSAFRRFRRERNPEPVMAQMPAPAVAASPVAPDVPPPPALVPPLALVPPPAAPAIDAWLSLELATNGSVDAETATRYLDEPFVTDPAYVEPAPATMPIPGF
jgi:hypothetical protein